MRVCCLVLVVVAWSCAESVPQPCPIDSQPCASGCCRLCDADGDCPEEQGCCGGSCSGDCQRCAATQERCTVDHLCHDVATELEHCSACGMSCVDAFGGAVDTCAGGRCVCGSLAGPCPNGLRCCDGACIDSSTNLAHCGGCDGGCDAGQVCVAGVCEVDTGACESGSRCVVAGGAECVDTQTAVNHCGDCDTDCLADLGARIDSCVAGACVCVAEGSACIQDTVCGGAGCTEAPCDGLSCPLGCCDTEGDCQIAGTTTCGTAGGVCIDCVTEHATAVDSCVAGACSCAAAGEVCTGELFCAATGCVTEVVECAADADGTECGERACDGLVWERQVCGGGTCSGVDTVEDCDDDNECSDDACDVSLGCSTVQRDTGSSCSIGSCNAAGTCVECLVAADCGTDGYIDAATCSGGHIKRTDRTYSCDAGVCSHSDALVTVQSCTCGCSGSTCNTGSCGTNNCGSDGCGGSCGTCSAGSCYSGRCAEYWTHGNDGSQTCSTICFWGWGQQCCGGRCLGVCDQAVTMTCECLTYTAG